MMKELKFRICYLEKLMSKALENRMKEYEHE